MIRALLAIGLLQLIAMLLMLAKTKVLAVALGPSDVGLIAVIDRYVALAAQGASLSLPFAALRFLPAALRESPQRMHILRAQMQSILLCTVMIATAGCTLVAIFAPQVWGGALAGHSMAIILGFAGVPIVAMLPFFVNALAGAMDHDKAMRVSVLHAFVLFASALIAASGAGITGFYASYALAGAAVLAWINFRYTSESAAIQHSEAWRRLSLPPEIWRFSFAIFLLTVAAPLASLYVQYSVLVLFGAAASGVLQAAIGISLAVRGVLGAALAVLLTPLVNREGDSAQRMDQADQFLSGSSLLFIALVVPLLLFADIAVITLYSAEFLPAFRFVALFVLAEVIMMISGAYQSLIVAADRLVFHVVQNLAAQAILVGVAVFWLPRLGMLATGAAALATAVFLFTTTIWYLSRTFGVRMSGGARSMAALSVALLVVAGLAGEALAGLGLIPILAKALACVVMWWVAWKLLPQAQRQQAAALAESVGARLRGTSDGNGRR